MQEVLPPGLDINSEQPPLFDGTTRLYTSYHCPFAQRVWIARNYKGLQDIIKLVPMDLWNKPAWYKEKVYPPNKVPALEHNNEIRGESLDLIKYIDNHFEGPALLPVGPTKRELAKELLSYSDSFIKVVFSSFASKGDAESEVGASLDYIESALSKFDDGPFFLGQFSMVDIAYAPFIERSQIFFLEVKKYDSTTGRPNLATWIEEMNKIDAYVQTRQDPKETIETMMKRFSVK
ncbi:protein IN2-1 homolog B-like [Tasmannia lanceolata]|uniref:protein IN2-1 homolog B-like n=1 Tax=Tasmannia lanceolata TaxID=3420 RepID=UPI0040649BEC